MARTIEACIETRKIFKRKIWSLNFLATSKAWLFLAISNHPFFFAVPEAFVFCVISKASHLGVIYKASLMPLFFVLFVKLHFRAISTARLFLSWILSISSFFHVSQFLQSHLLEKTLLLKFFVKNIIRTPLEWYQYLFNRLIKGYPTTLYV